MPRPSGPLSPPGILRVVVGQPNPAGCGASALYLFSGDAATAPITQLALDSDVQLPARQNPGVRANHLHLLHFNDLHGHLVAFGQAEAKPSLRHLPVFSRMVARMHAARRAAKEDARRVVMVASAGDEMGAIFDELLCSSEGAACHAAYRVYAAAGVDVAVVGNHDLDRGEAVLAQGIRSDARFPILAANLTGSPALAEWCFAAALFVVKGLRVGLIGLTTPAQVHRPPGSQLVIADPVQTAHHLIPVLQPLCDVLILLSHLGLSLAVRSALTAVAGDVELARQLAQGDRHPPVHLIVGGHTHHALNEGGLAAENIASGIPIVQAGKMGQFLGEVEMAVHEEAVVTDARLHCTADLPVDTAFERQVIAPMAASLQAHWQRRLGRVTRDPTLSTAEVRSSLAAGESALANFITDGLASQCRARGVHIDLAMLDGSNIRSGLPVGRTLTYGHWFTVMPFADTVRLFRLTGRQLVELLQDNARRIDRRDEPHTERGFLHFSRELRYTITLGETRATARSQDVMLAGRSLAERLDDTFMVASSSFVRQPAAAWEASEAPVAAERVKMGRPSPHGSPFVDLRQFPQEETGWLLRDMLAAYITAHGGVMAAGGARRDGRLALKSGDPGARNPVLTDPLSYPPPPLPTN